MMISSNGPMRRPLSAAQKPLRKPSTSRITRTPSQNESCTALMKHLQAQLLCLHDEVLEENKLKDTLLSCLKDKSLTTGDCFQLFLDTTWKDRYKSPPLVARLFHELTQVDDDGTIVEGLTSLLEKGCNDLLNNLTLLASPKPSQLSIVTLLANLFYLEDLPLLHKEGVESYLIDIAKAFWPYFMPGAPICVTDNAFIDAVCDILRAIGKKLDANCPVNMERTFNRITMLLFSSDGISRYSRMRLMEIKEARAAQWMLKLTAQDYYKDAYLKHFDEKSHDSVRPDSPNSSGSSGGSDDVFASQELETSSQCIVSEAMTTDSKSLGSGVPQVASSVECEGAVDAPEANIQSGLSAATTGNTENLENSLPESKSPSAECEELYYKECHQSKELDEKTTSNEHFGNVSRQRAKSSSAIPEENNQSGLSAATTGNTENLGNLLPEPKSPSTECEELYYKECHQSKELDEKTTNNEHFGNVSSQRAKSLSAVPEENNQSGLSAATTGNTENLENLLPESKSPSAECEELYYKECHQSKEFDEKTTNNEHFGNVSRQRAKSLSAIPEENAKYHGFRARGGFGSPGRVSPGGKNGNEAPETRQSHFVRSISEDRVITEKGGFPSPGGLDRTEIFNNFQNFGQHRGAHLVRSKSDGEEQQPFHHNRFPPQQDFQGSSSGFPGSGNDSRPVGRRFSENTGLNRFDGQYVRTGNGFAHQRSRSEITDARVLVGNGEQGRFNSWHSNRSENRWFRSNLEFPVSDVHVDESEVDCNYSRTFLLSFATSPVATSRPQDLQLDRQVDWLTDIVLPQTLTIKDRFG